MAQSRPERLYLMQKLRSRYVMKWILYVILLMIIPSFVLFYGFSATDMLGGQQRFSSGEYAEVKTSTGTRVVDKNRMLAAQEDLANEFALILWEVQRQRPTSQDVNAIRRSLSMKEIADYAVSEIALEDLAQRQDIVVTTDQLQENLKRQGISQSQLESFLRAQGMTEQQFIRRQTAAMRDDRAEGLIRSMARVSLLELWQEYRLQNDRISAKYAKVSVEDLIPSVEVTDEAVRTYFEDHREDYIKREERTYRFIALNPPSVQTDTEVTDEELQEAYEQIDLNAEPSFASSGGATVRQIVLRVDEGDDPEEIRGQAEQLRQQIAEGADFATLANENSEDLDNIRTGEDQTAEFRGGIVSRRVEPNEAQRWIGQYGEEWFDWVNQAEPGELSDVIGGPDLFVVARVEDRLPAGEKKPLAEVKDLLTSRIVGKRRQQQMAERQEAADANEFALKEAAAKHTSLDGLAREVGAEVQTSEPTPTVNYSISGIGSLRRFTEILDELEVGEISPVLRTDSGTVAVIQIENVDPERPNTLEEVRQRVEQDYRMQMAVEKAKEVADSIKESVESGQSLEDAAIEQGVEDIVDVVDFKRGEPPTDLRQAQDFAYRSFRSGEGEAFVISQGFMDSVLSYLVVVQAEVREPDKTDFLKEMKSLETSLRAVKADAFLQEYRRDSVNFLNPEFDEELAREERI